ncbi:MAG TPA: class I SAM-dependent methyltransferase [Planctomycetes bacterium]|nr:class I SAM-dependent methyltransferase [Planctomycetota bacterium]
MNMSVSAYYDDIYHWKDYKQESEDVLSWIRRYQPEAKTLLDVACGTGGHMVFFQEAMEEVVGLDLDPPSLEVARKKMPGVSLIQGDMRAFDLGRRFDALTCLFSAIGYVHDYGELEQSLRCFAAHLEPGGVLVLEGWMSPEDMKPDGVWMHLVDQPELKIARLNTIQIQGNVSSMTLHHLIGTPEGVRYAAQDHRLVLFEREEYRAAIRNAGLTLVDEPDGLMKRNTFVAQASSGP